MSSVIKAKSEPSFLFPCIYACLMMGFGGLLGFIYLMSFPLKAYSNMQERAEALETRESLSPIPGEAFYIEGPTLRSPSWQTKREQLIDSSAGTIMVTAGEINAWLEAKFSTSPVSSGEEDKGLLIAPDSPNIGITNEGTTYLNLPAGLSVYGMSDTIVFSAEVRYASGTPVRLLIDRLQIGGAAVPFPSFLGNRIVSAFLKAFSSAEEYAIISKAWNRVQSVEVSDGAFFLILDMR